MFCGNALTPGYAAGVFSSRAFPTSLFKALTATPMPSSHLIALYPDLKLNCLLSYLSSDSSPPSGSPSRRLPDAQKDAMPIYEMNEYCQ